MIINIDGREVQLTCIHVGVDLSRVDEILMSKTYIKEMNSWKERFKNKIVVAGK